MDEPEGRDRDRDKGSFLLYDRYIVAIKVVVDLQLFVVASMLNLRSSDSWRLRDARGYVPVYYILN